jgi:hypothetical protein
MKMPFRRTKSLPERMLQMAAAGAGATRLAVKRRRFVPHVMPHKNGSGVTRALRRG